MLVLVLHDRLGFACPAERPRRAELDDRRHVELPTDHVRDDRHLHREVDRHAWRDRERRPGPEDHVDATAVAVVGVHDAAPALGGLGLHVRAAAQAPPRAHGPPQHEATGEAIAGLVALAVRVEHLLREREAAAAPASPRARELEHAHGVHRAGAHLDVLVREAHVAEGEWIVLGATDRNASRRRAR